MDPLKHILSSRQFTLGFLVNLYKDTAKIIDLMKDREGRGLLTHVLPGYVIGEIFWQESSRTYHSFASAGHRLGAQVVPERGVKVNEVKGGKKVTRWRLAFSSEMKDAWLEDEVRAWASFYDLLVLRTPDDIEICYLKEILESSGYLIPLVSAGDGKREHPTQTLLDVFTLCTALGLDDIESGWQKLQNSSVAFINDCKNSRTIHSLAWILGTLFNMRLIFIAPDELRAPREMLDNLERAGCKFKETDRLEPADAYYVTRHQFEYGDKKRRGITVRKKDADANGVKVIMHPFPRSKKGNELPIWLPSRPETHRESLDKDPRAFYFYQMAVGVPVRMALLKYLLNPHLEFQKLREERLERSYNTQCHGCGRIESGILGWSEHPVRYLQTLSHIPFCPTCLKRPEKEPAA